MIFEFLVHFKLCDHRVDLVIKKKAMNDGKCNT